MKDSTTRTVRKLCLFAAGLALAAQAGAVVQKQQSSDLSSLTFESSRLTVAPENAPLEEARSAVGLDADLAFHSFVASDGGHWVGYVDLRTGQIGYFEGSGLAWVPGRGNALPLDAVTATPGLSMAVDLALLDGKARDFARTAAPMLGIDPAGLVLNAGRSGSPSAHVWFVDYDYVMGGVPVEGARVVFSVNNGNLVAVGSENLPMPGSRMPRVAVSANLAREAVEAWVGGFRGDEVWVDTGTFHLLPANRIDQRFDGGYEPGRGRDVAGVWQFSFRRPGEVGTFRARVDVESGDLLDFLDVNEYGSVTGGTYQQDRVSGSTPATERVLPMPFANYGTGVYSNSAGIFSGTTGTTTLSGQYVGISDSCGSISKAADASGNIALGSSTGTDCTTPGTGGSGNTHAARTQYYNVTRAKEVGKGWLPSNSWLNGKLTVNVNLNQTCNAYWNGSSLNFFRSGGGCNNTGESPGVSLHEWGHGLDSNDGGGSSPDNGTGETYGDFSAALATHNSCIGNGFLQSGTCGGYGNTCTSCSGVRDIDWAKHTRNVASTVANFTQTTCPQPSAQNPNYVGPCGKDAIARAQTTKKREGHCESYPSSEALWDLAARDLPSPGSGAAWTVVDRLWYLSRSTASAAFQCNVSGTTWTSDGCNTGSLFKVFRTIDDDNGNLADGTPHGGAIAAAFNRHGLACTTDAGWNVTFRAVSQPAAPTLAVTAGNNSAALSWSGSSGVYDVYRNETGCNAGFTKVANDVAASSYNDAAVANGITYYYQVLAQPSGNEAAASAPSTCQSVTPVAGPCTPPAAPTGVSASSSSQTAASVSWAAASGATSYTISRSTTSGGPYSSVGTSATTSFADSGLTCNTTYYYVVSASNGTCSSANSAQASVTTATCSAGNVLANGVPVTNISGASASTQTWTLAVPAGSTNLSFQISGGSGDADMYVRFGAAPTTSTYDCRPYLSGNSETCSFASPSTGTYYVMLRGYSAFSGVTLVGSYTPGGSCTPPAVPTGVSATSSSQTSATVSWTASSGASSYPVSRSTITGGPYSSVGTATTTSFTNTGLTCNTTYYFVVAASNGTCASANSAQASVTTAACSSSCTAVAESESNNTRTTADPLVAPCSTVAGTFSTDTNQNDYFSMSIPAGKTVTALLNGLTVDYDLYLYNSAGTQLAKSTNGGTTADQVAWTNSGASAATVYVRVYRYSSTRTTYTLKVSYP